MKKIYILIIILIISGNLFSQQTDLLNLANSLSVENIKSDVYTLASDKMQGRETGKKGQRLAAIYIYNQFKKAGLLSYQLQSDSLSYFQNFELFQNASPQIDLSINGKRFIAFDDFSLTGYSNLKLNDVDLVFLGTAPDSIYKNRNFSDKAVLFLTSNLFSGVSKAMEIIKETKAKIVFYCNPLNPHQLNPIIQRQTKMQSVRQFLDPEKFPVNNPFDSIQHKALFEKVEQIKKSYHGPISEKVVAKILNVKLRNLKKLVNDSSASLNNLPEIKMNFEFTNNYQTKTTENVIACIPGTEYKNESIVVSAHYDHIGINGNKIYYGANDNASGTAALLEIARKLKYAVDSGMQLKRSVIFATFTAEEKGLLGSKYFVESFQKPHSCIKANLNIDMLGRKDNKHEQGNFIYLIGAGDLNPKFRSISDSINYLYPKFELDYSYDFKDNFLYSASDQASFVNRNIPAIFYFNGLHNDYHKSSDTPDKIDYDAIKKVSGLILLTSIELANQ
jgi:hypothetical protein